MGGGSGLGGGTTAIGAETADVAGGLGGSVAVVLGPGVVTLACAACEGAPGPLAPPILLGVPLGVAVEGPAAGGRGGKDDADVAAGGLAGGPDVGPPREGLGAGELAPVEEPEGG